MIFNLIRKLLPIVPGGMPLGAGIDGGALLGAGNYFLARRKLLVGKYVHLRYFQEFLHLYGH